MKLFKRLIYERNTKAHRLIKTDKKDKINVKKEGIRLFNKAVYVVLVYISFTSNSETKFDIVIYNEKGELYDYIKQIEKINFYDLIELWLNTKDKDLEELYYENYQ